MQSSGLLYGDGEGALNEKVVSDVVAAIRKAAIKGHGKDIFIVDINCADFG